MSSKFLYKDEIKRRVSIEQVLTHYGSPPNAKGIFHCPFPENHHNGDNNPSGSIFDDRAKCHSQGCLGEKGSDIFDLVGKKESIRRFPDQMRQVVELFLPEAVHRNG